MRRILLAWVALISLLRALNGQVATPGDSATVMHAMASYLLVHPISGDGSHGPMLGIAVDSAAHGWGALLSAAVRQERPATWLDPASAAARDQPHVRILHVASAGDSAMVAVLWARCFAGNNGESFWPADYTLRRAGPDWRVERAVAPMAGHGRMCEYDRTPAR